MGRCEIGSMGDYVRLDPERAGAELAKAERKLAAIKALTDSWAVDDDTYLHLDGQDLGYADAAVQINAIIENQDAHPERKPDK